MDRIQQFIKQHGNPFAQLEIPMTQDKKLIKKQYKDLAKIHHPDKSNSSERFIAIKHAYNFIIDNISLWEKYIEGAKYRELEQKQQSKEQKFFADDLKRREAQAEKQKQDRDELQRMRVQEEINLLNQQAQKEKDAKKQKEDEKIKFQLENQESYRKLNSIKVKWNQDEFYNTELLELVFKNYGPIKNIKMKDYAAIIQFHTTEAANNAVLSADQSQLKVSFKMKQDKRDKLQAYLKQANDNLNRKGEEIYQLNSDTLKRIAHFYNKDVKVIVDDELDLLRRQQEKQRLIQQIYEEEVNK